MPGSNQMNELLAMIKAQRDINMSKELPTKVNEAHDITEGFFAKLQREKTIPATNQDITDRVEQKMAHISEVANWPSGEVLNDVIQKASTYPTGPADRPDVIWNNEKEEAEWWDNNSDYIIDAFKAKYAPDISKMQEALKDIDNGGDVHSVIGHAMTGWDNKKSLQDTDDVVLDVAANGLTKTESHQEIVASLIPGLPKNHVLFKPFENNTGIANFGSGSFSGMNVRDLRANVVTDEKGKAETTQETIKVHERRQANLPLLRYINLSGSSIELRFHQDGTNLISAFKVTQNGKVFTQMAERLSPRDLLLAISERALGYPERVTQEASQKTLEDVSTLSDEE